MNIEDNRILIISNNALSYTRSNGKTVLSYFDNLPKNNIRQLYFSNEKPSVEGYEYFQLSDKDIIKGKFNKSKRGRSLEGDHKYLKEKIYSNSNRVKGDFFRIMRETLWLGSWKSKQLINWLDEFNPNVVFFVAGDSVFAYNIFDFIVEKYNAKSSIFLTDDYIMPRENENIISKFRRNWIRKKMKNSISNSNNLITISETMKKEYDNLFNKNSHMAVNMSDSLLLDSIEVRKNEDLSIIYAGSIYYGRDDVLYEIGKSISTYNKEYYKNNVLKIYTNIEPTKDELTKLNVDNGSKYLGSLNKDELIQELNKADILLIVESFDSKQIEKTKYSLSTKVSEYLSVNKPLISVGPKEIGSMQYLSDCSYYIDDISTVYESLEKILNSSEVREEYAELARNRYINNHNKEKNQRELQKLVLR